MNAEQLVDKGGKVPISVKVGYGIGTAGDSIPYNLFFTYFLFYLTDVAGVRPSIAGTISFVAVLWDAVTDPTVGYLSDNSKNPKGRRRPWILRSIWPLAIVTFLLFLPNDFSGMAQGIYYMLMAILLWTFYTTYCVPYAALGAEITHDYNERNVMRMIVGLLAYPFVALCNSGPMWILSLLTPKGVDVKQCWCIAGAAAAVIIVICGLITYRTTKGREDSQQELHQMVQQPKENFFKTYREMFKMKAYRNLILTGLFYIVGYTLFSGIGVYMFTYCAGMNSVQQGTFWTLYTLIAIACTPVSILVANKIGSKKKTLLLFSFLFCGSCVAFYMLGLTSFWQVMLFGALVALSTSAFWGLYYSAVYDCSEIDEFVNGKRREGSVVACAQFFQKLGGAVATSGTGWLLTAFGYTGGTEQSAGAVHGILLISTLIPAALVLISMLIFLKYPLTKEKHDALRVAIQKRMNGEEYSTEKFKDVL